MADNFDSNLEDEKERLKIQKGIRESLKDQVNSIGDMASYGADILRNYKEIRSINKDIAKNQKTINQLLEQAKTANKEEAELLKKRAAAIAQENEELKKQAAQLKAINKQMASTGNFLRGLFNVTLNYAKQSVGAYLDFDQKTRDVAASIGLSNDRMYQMRREIDGARAMMISYGYSVEDAITAQSTYSGELGRAVILSESALENMSKVAKATGMGMEEMAGMSSEMANFGYGAEDSAKFIYDMYAESSKMGLNAANVSKKFRQNLTLLNKLNFKDGVKGLKTMTMLSEKFKIDMQSVAAAAEHLNSIENSIEAAANLQVLGGQFAAMADPIQLFYKARNAPEELTQSFAEAAGAAAKFNKQTGEVTLNAVEMDRLRLTAKALNLDFENLVDSAKRVRLNKEFSQLLNGKGLDAKTQEAVSMMAEMKDGKAQINFIDKNGMRVVKDLKSLTKTEAQNLIQQKEDAQKAAEQATGVKQQYEALFNNMITTLWPLFERLMPRFKDIADRIAAWATKFFDGTQNFLENFGKDWDIEGFLNTVADVGRNLITAIKEIANSPLVKAITSFVSNNAGWLLGIGLLVKYLGPMLSPISWYLKGIQLGAGFNASQRAGGGGILSTLFGGRGRGGATPPPVAPTPPMGGGAQVAGQASGMSSMMSSLGSAAQILAIGAALMMVAKALDIFGDAMLKLNQVPAGLLVGVGVGLLVFVETLGALGASGIGLMGVGIMLAVGAALLMIGGAVWLVAQGMTSVVDAFTRMFTILPTAGTQLLDAGLGFMSMAAGIGILTASLIALSAASFIALPGMLMLGAVTGMLVGTAAALSSVGGGDGLTRAVEAINSVDVSKLDALKSLSMWMALLGSDLKVSFDENLTVQGSIELVGEKGKATVDMNNPEHIKALKDAIFRSADNQKQGKSVRQ